MPAQTTQTLTDILVSQGTLSPEKAKQIKLSQIQTGVGEEDFLKSKGWVEDDALAAAKATLYNIPFVDLTSVPAFPEALAALPQDVAERFVVFPVSLDKVGRQIVLAMANPMDLAAIDFIERKTGYRVKPQVATGALIKEFISTKYAQSLSKEVTEAVADVVPEKEEVGKLGVSSRFGFVKEEKIAEIVSHILSFAAKARASDVHIEPQEKSTRVRYRIDGILQEKLTIPKEIHDSLISRIKILSGMKIDEKRIPQDGRFNFKSGDMETDLRVSSLPTSWGRKS